LHGPGDCDWPDSSGDDKRTSVPHCGLCGRLAGASPACGAILGTSALSFAGLPMLTVYGRATSSNTQLVMWAIGELGLPCERLDYGGVFGRTRTPEYLA